MAISQSQKPQTIKTTNPQSSRLAGFTDTTLEDASAWNTVDGVKQDRGWAYADGSTLVNTSGKYDSYLARTGSLVLPSGPFRTELMDLSSYITHSESWDSYSAEGYFSSDLSGQWFLEVQVKGSGNDDRVIASSSLTFTNIFVQTSPSNESVGAAAGQTSSRSIPVQAYISSSSSIVFRAGPNGVADTARYFNVFGKIKLSGKPTIPSFDTFLLDYPVVQLYDSIAAGALGLPEASDTQSGIVSTGAQTFAGDKTFTGNVDAASYSGLPEASASQSGIVTTGTQTFAGIKTIQDGVILDAVSTHLTHFETVRAAISSVAGNYVAGTGVASVVNGELFIIRHNNFFTISGRAPFTTDNSPNIDREVRIDIGSLVAKSVSNFVSTTDVAGNTITAENSTEKGAGSVYALNGTTEIILRYEEDFPANSTVTARFTATGEFR